MGNLKDLIVNGVARIIGNLYVGGNAKVNGDVTINASSGNPLTIDETDSYVKTTLGYTPPHVVELTQAQYDDLATKDPNITYAITDNNGVITKADLGLSNSNLLDNPFFTINSRKVTSPIWGNGYLFDRWTTDYYYADNVHYCGINYNNDNSIDIISSSDAEAGAYIHQFVNIVIGETYTISAYIRGRLIQATGTITSTNSELSAEYDNSYIKLAYGANYQHWYFRFGVTPNTAGIYQGYVFSRVKLEHGTVSTLPNDSEPDYGTEYIKCITSTVDPLDDYANKMIVSTKDVLSLDEIKSSTSLAGKVPSADALKAVNTTVGQLSSDLADKIKVEKIIVSNVDVNTSWGNVYISSPREYTLNNIDFTYARAFIVQFSGGTVFATVEGTTKTSIKVTFLRGTIARINGTLYVIAVY